MDPVSMTASIIAVLQLTTTLTSYINDVKKATSDQAKVAIEASNLFGLLTSLRFRVETARSDDPWFQQVRMLGIHDGPLDQFKDILNRMVENVSASRKRDQIKSALMWKFTKSEIDDALIKMERLKSCINCALVGDLLTLSQVIHDDVIVLREQTRSLHIKAETVGIEELQKKISRWLGLPDPSVNFHAALEKRHPGTGLWLVNGQQFKTWKSSTSALMWLHGNAGCGKTVLSAASLQETLLLKGVQSNTVVSYFYFDFNDVEKQSSKKAIRSLLFQFTMQQQDRLQHLEKLYRICGNGHEQPAENAIRSLFMDAIACTGHKYIILDALDECKDREDFALFIREMFHSQQEGLRILITSRRERDIEEQLGSIATYNINIQSAIVDEDIRRYVVGRLATDSKLKKWPKKVQDDIVRVMMEKAGGMFRWVYCQLESIRQCVKLSALQKSLSTLPRTLFETYDRILQVIESAEQLHDAIKVLRWLCFSKCPLRLSDLIEVMAIENGDNGGFEPDERLPDPNDIRVVCSSLISCNNETYSDGTHATHIRLAHFSVQEYLLSDECPLRIHFQTLNCHLAMAESCLHYLLHLCKNLPLTEELIRQHPLSRYVAEYWWQHAQATNDNLNSTVIFLSVKLLTDAEAGVLPWVQLYNIDKPWESVFPLRVGINDIAPPLYYATSTGLLQIVKHILPQVADINGKGGSYGSALAVASYHGKEKMIQVLLDAGADVNAKGGSYGSALQIASAGGHQKVVQLLLNSGADVTIKGGNYGTALQAASEYGDETVVQILLNAGADVNDRGFHGTALQAASTWGHERVVQILLHAGADVNAEGGEYGTALQAAITKNKNGSRAKEIQMLLDSGAEE